VNNRTILWGGDARLWRVLVIQGHVTVAKLWGTGSFPGYVVGSYGSLFIVWGRSSVILGISIVTRGRGQRVVVELDRLVLPEFHFWRTQIEDGWWDACIVELEWHNPGSDRRYCIRIKRGESLSHVTHVRRCGGRFTG